MSRSIPGEPDDRPPDAELAAAIADLMHRINRRIRQRANDEFGPLGLTPGQLRVLRTLRQRQAPMRMSELADALGIARRSATSVVDDLVLDGRVARRDDPDDRRSVLVELTSAGVEVLRDAHARRHRAAEAVFGALSADDRRRLEAILRRVAG
jgi:DNA-binding MarR family transcriptional regulator